MFSARVHHARLSRRLFDGFRSMWLASLCAGVGWRKPKEARRVGPIEKLLPTPLRCACSHPCLGLGVRHDTKAAPVATHVRDVGLVLRGDGVRDFLPDLPFAIRGLGILDPLADVASRCAVLLPPFRRWRRLGAPLFGPYSS